MLVNTKVDFNTFKFEDTDKFYLDFEVELDGFDDVEVELTKEQAFVLYNVHAALDQGEEPDHAAYNTILADVRKRLKLDGDCASNAIFVYDVRAFRERTNEVFTTI